MVLRESVSYELAMEHSFHLNQLSELQNVVCAINVGWVSPFRYLDQSSSYPSALRISLRWNVLRTIQKMNIQKKVQVDSKQKRSRKAALFTGAEDNKAGDSPSIKSWERESVNSELPEYENASIQSTAWLRNWRSYMQM